MADASTFQCPKCGAGYTRERRRVGKAVVCTCGHKFLVPPDDAATPTAAPPVTPPRGRAAAVHRTPDRRTRISPAEVSDASGEVIPLAEPIEPASSPVRWAEPVEPRSAEPVMEAEVVHADNPYAEPLSPEDDIFGPASPYAMPIAEVSYPPLLPSAPPPPPKSIAKKRKKRRAAGDGAVNYSNWVAYFVLFFILPVAGILTLIGLSQHRPQAPGGAARQQPPQQQTAPAPRATNEPPASGHAITIWNAQRSASGEFSVEYRLDRGALDSSRQYFWVVDDRHGRIEFPIPANAMKPHDKLSGRPAGLAPGQFIGPYTTFIEEQSGSSRNRVSNELPF